MATITTTTLIDGPRNLVVLVNLSGTGDETGTLLIDRSDFGAGTETVVERIEGSVFGFIASLAFDATTDLTFAHLPDNSFFCFDWRNVGGVSSNKAGAGANGDILITTVGLASETGTFTLFMRKA